MPSTSSCRLPPNVSGRAGEPLSEAQHNTAVVIQPNPSRLTAFTLEREWLGSAMETCAAGVKPAGERGHRTMAVEIGFLLSDEEKANMRENAKCTRLSVKRVN